MILCVCACVCVCVCVCGGGGWVCTCMHGCMHVDVHDSECSGVVSEFLIFLQDQNSICYSTQQIINFNLAYINKLYKAKLLSGKTFTVIEENGCLQENFTAACLWTRIVNHKTICYRAASNNS